MSVSNDFLVSWLVEFQVFRTKNKQTRRKIIRIFAHQKNAYHSKNGYDAMF